METLWLDIDARGVIEAESARRRLRETGGPLFGYDAEEGGVVVVRAFGPGPNARHRRFHYVPDRRDTQAAIERVFKESDGSHLYLGEWHSHPLGPARPSGTDITTLADIAAEEAVGLRQPIALIQQTKTVRPTVVMGALVGVRWNPEGRRAVRMQVELTAGSAPERRFPGEN
jgi:integrative and conjugative element protein (TIGR02256 family)